MTVSTTNTYSGPYLPNGVTVAFPFTFKALSAVEVVVVTVTDGVETLVDDASYSVTLADPGGTVTFTTAPAATIDELYVLSDPLFTQTSAFTNQGAFLPAVFNMLHDRAAVRDQYLKRETERAIKAPVAETIGVLPSAVDRAGMFLAFDANGNPVPASGSGGGDTALRADLATPTGAGLIGANILSADARARSLLDRFREHPSVFDFEGIHGDNVQDDYTAIRKAIEWAGANKKSLLAPKANYRISDTLVFDTVGWEFIGEGIASTRFWCTTAAPAALVSGFAGTMKGIDLRGEGVSETGIILLSASLSRFENVDCIDFAGDGLLFDSAWDGGALTGRQNNIVIIDGCQFSNNDGCGVRMKQQPDNNGCAFRDMTINSNGSHGFLLKGEGNEVRGGNIFANAGYGVQIGEASDGSFNVSNLIHGCWIESNVLGGVRGGGRSLRNWIWRKNLSQSYTAAPGSADMEVTLGGGGLITYNNGASTIALDTDGNVIKINGTQIIGPRETGWAAMTGAATKTAIATYTAGADLTYGAAYAQAEHTAAATRIAAIEAAVQANSRRLKAIDDMLRTHGLMGA